MSQKHHLRDLAVSETGFVFDPFTGATFTTNPTGYTILLGLREDLSRAEIAAKIRERFVIHTQDVESDIADFVQLLRQHGIVPDGFTV